MERGRKGVLGDGMLVYGVQYVIRVVVIGEEAVYGRGSTLTCVGRWDIGVRNAVSGKEGKLV